MDRCAIFVDAGYLYAGAGQLCCKTRSRHQLILDAPAANSLLCQIAHDGCQLPVLRTYWYDGAKKGIPSTAQHAIGALPNVKLRLGRINARNEQKGVDALIYRDLMTLSRERSITDAYLLSGDEDLREGVKTAQDQGIRVTLIGIAPPGKGHNQSLELVEEADETIVLTKVELSPIISRVPAAVVTVAPPAPAPVAAVTAPSVASTTPHPAHAAGKQFAQSWLAQATTADILALQGAAPRIPKALDVELLQAVEQTLQANFHGDDKAHRAMRLGFWEDVKAAKPGP